MEIGPLPAPRCPGRREMCRDSLAKFVSCYFPLRAAPTPAQSALQQRHEEAIVRGGCFLNRVHRSIGTTTQIMDAVIWALFNGYARYVLLVGPNQLTPMSVLELIKIEIECNHALLADFPEICMPIVAARGIVQRFSSQVLHGESTNVHWSGTWIALPSIDGSAASGSRFEVTGVMSSLRGLTHRFADGSTTRPDLVICDGHQTQASDESASRSELRAKIVNRDLPYLGANRKPFSLIVDEPYEFRSVDPPVLPGPRPTWNTRNI